MLLIDGYNLLHATDLFGSGAMAGTLQGSREALLAFLAGALNPRERSQTTIVFDAAGAPPGLPKIVPWEGMTARFARGYEDADALLEEIIEEHPAEDVDRRIRRSPRATSGAAPRAKVVESEAWFKQLRRRRAQPDSVGKAEAMPIEDSSYWIEQFSDFEVPTTEIERPKDATSETNDFENPFPPGYGDDLLRDGSL